jgi:micrococcal nuclease
VAVLVLRGRDHPRATTFGRAQVLRVVDGDTIRVRLDGRTERVRYIGVDTPESVKPGTPVQCFAERASAFNKRLVAGEQVRLVRDAEERDRYGRLLAYVYRTRDNRFINATLVSGGYAVPLTIPPNVAHADEFRTLAAAARRKGRGLWSSCRSS